MSGRHREQALLPQGFWGAYKSVAKRRSNVGASLLAMSGRHREQALLPQGFWGAYKSAAKRRSHCGSEPARDSGVSVSEDAECQAAIASELGSHRFFGAPINLRPNADPIVGASLLAIAVWQSMKS
ncbi:hypothetical protein ASC85_05475 [Pseudomonas sp. Root401]|nr:hypothetical protein ASC85_05475 [Pseudomonas sp. Root401]